MPVDDSGCPVGCSTRYVNAGAVEAGAWLEGAIRASAEGVCTQRHGLRSRSSGPQGRAPLKQQRGLG
eukprot:2013091-Alexandrium_andersonii.AAC.1